jgi:threonine/homoserine efflux transporter RhtA
MNSSGKIYLALLYFVLSTLITWWFVDVCPLYSSLQQKLLSTGIAGAKWGLQIVAAYFFLSQKKWDFLKNMGATCLVGSVILVPYAFAASFTPLNDPLIFIASLIIAVLVMITLYFLNVQKLALPKKWFWGWIFCLAIAITLQLTVVFSVIKF